MYVVEFLQAKCGMSTTNLKHDKVSSSDKIEPSHEWSWHMLSKGWFNYNDPYPFGFLLKMEEILQSKLIMTKKIIIYNYKKNNYKIGPLLVLLAFIHKYMWCWQNLLLFSFLYISYSKMLLDFFPKLTYLTISLALS